MAGANKKSRIAIIILLCLVLITANLLCSMCAANHVAHNCQGKSCPECVRIAQTINLLRQLTVTAVVVACAFAAPQLLSRLVCLQPSKAIAPSLVGLKIRLDF